MKSLLVAILFSLFAAFGALAQTSSIDMTGMTPEQQKALQTMAEQLKSNQAAPATILEAIKSLDIDKETVSGWAQAGTEAGKAVTNFTNEIAVPAQEFLDSFIGKAVFLIVFMNYGGGKLASFFLNIGIFVVLTPIYLVFINQVFRRFVLHQRLEGKAWFPVRTKEAGERIVGKEEGEPATVQDLPITVNTAEAVAGWAFVVVTTTFYLLTMWPTWPL